MAEILVLYYSQSGSVAQLANHIARGVDITERRERARELVAEDEAQASAHARGSLPRRASFRQRSEQYFTSCQTFSHFLRQANDNPQLAQVLVGKSAFLRIFVIVPLKVRLLPAPAMQIMQFTRQ